MSDKPKRGRPKKNPVIDISNLSEEDKLKLLKSLNDQLGIKPLKKGKRTFENKFVDDGTLCVEDKSFTEKVKFKVTPRDRPSSGKEAKCERCGNTFTKYYTEYLCNDCGSKK